MQHTTCIAACRNPTGLSSSMIVARNALYLVPVWHLVASTDVATGYYRKIHNVETVFEKVR